MNVLLSIVLTLSLHTPVVVPSCCPVTTMVAVRVVPVLAVPVPTPPAPPVSSLASPSPVTLC